MTCKYCDKDTFHLILNRGKMCEECRDEYDSYNEKEEEIEG